MSEAIPSNRFWSYMVMISALATGIEEIRRFSKSCPCHIESIDENGHLMSFRRRVLAFQKLGGLRNLCPAKGLLAPWMALGKGRDIVQEYVSKCRRLMLMSFDPLTRRERDSIQGELDGAAAVLCGEFDFKLEDWSGFTLKICALRHPDQSLARSAARWRKAQFW